jgi:hypothetical protein
VKQPEGFIDLCMMGRIQRAYKRLAEAKAAGEMEKATAMQTAIDALTQMADKAMSAAEKAVSDYCAQCIVEGKEPEDLYPVECLCVGCQETGKIHKLGEVVGNMRAAVWAFMGDDGQGQPPILALMSKARQDENARDQLWRHLYKISETMQAYVNVCRETGVRPNWKKELWS